MYKAYASRLTLVTRLVVVLQLDFFANGRLNLSTAVQSARRCVDVIQ